jgi:gas vesicle protein
MKDELATKKDLKTTQAGLETALKKTKTELESAIKKNRTELESVIKETKTDLESSIQKNRTELESVIKDTKTGLETAIKETRIDLESAIHETKKELQGQINVVNWRMDRIDERLSNFQNESGQKLDTIITAVDGLAKLITDGQTEKVAVNSALYRLEDRAENHEKRIGILETKI